MASGAALTAGEAEELQKVLEETNVRLKTVMLPIHVPPSSFHGIAMPITHACTLPMEMQGRIQGSEISAEMHLFKQ